MRCVSLRVPAIFWRAVEDGDKGGDDDTFLMRTMTRT